VDCTLGSVVNIGDKMPRFRPLSPALRAATMAVDRANAIRM
jgi:hypothetical protein